MSVRFFIFSFISTVITLGSVNAQVADQSPVPAVFTCGGILIVEKPEYKNTIPGYEKRVKKEFENYKGKYVMANKKEIEKDTIYNDKITYRFILHLDFRQEMGGSKPRTRIFYFINDRETNTRYKGIGEKRTGVETLEHTVRMLNANCKL